MEINLPDQKDNLNEKTEHAPKLQKQSKKSIFSQVLAGSAQNLLLLNLGVASSFATMIIADLLNSKEKLSLTEEQASWFGSVNMILQPLGSLASGFILEPLGRKKALCVVNFPMIVAWLMIYAAPNTTVLFCANALLGLGHGFMEAPILAYIGEISHPSVRGALITYGQLFVYTGIFLAYLMGTVMHWRLAAASFILIPLITFITIYFIPESPVWLLSKNREGDALKALCWTRGWTKPEKVKEEFDELLMYQKNSMKCKYCTKSGEKQTCPHKNVSLIQKLIKNYKMMTRKEMLRPYVLLTLMFVFFNLTGVNAIKPNMVNVYKVYGLNIDGHLATILTGAIGMFTSVILMLIIKKTGKRVLFLISALSSSVCLGFLGLYAFLKLPHDASSYKPLIESTETSALATFLFIALNICNGLGLSMIPWIMMPEVFPLRGRGLACGITAGTVYIMNSVISKTYYNLETSLRLFGAMWFYCGCTLLGFFIMYFILPETEGKSLAEIEASFSKKKIMIYANDPLSNSMRRLIRKNRNTVSTEQEGEINRAKNSDEMAAF